MNPKTSWGNILWTIEAKWKSLEVVVCVLLHLAYYYQNVRKRASNQQSSHGGGGGVMIQGCLLPQDLNSLPQLRGPFLSLAGHVWPSVCDLKLTHKARQQNTY
ncbi:hypothetical protein AMECASPLE_008601 [Ameca splendens]|uniref:Uncharacterized protein n=1 Tax=Ameca splendens TaxID=208324 RepID=A0ABV1A7E8_9TELE